MDSGDLTSFSVKLAPSDPVPDHLGNASRRTAKFLSAQVLSYSLVPAFPQAHADLSDPSAALPSVSRRFFSFFLARNQGSCLPKSGIPQLFLKGHWLNFFTP